MYAEPGITKLLSHAPLGPFAPSPDVDVCAAESLLANVTTPPASMVTTAGMKQFGSHPGVEEPAAFSTVAFIAAKASGVAYSPIVKRNIHDEINNSRFINKK